MATTLCRCKSAVINSITAGGLVSCSIIQDDEIIEKQYSDSRQKSIYGGGEVKGITVTVTDEELYTALSKGTRITSAVVVMEEAYDTDDTILGANTLTATLTGGYVSEAVELTSSTDGSPAEFAITMMLCRGKTGTEGTFAIS